MFFVDRMLRFSAIALAPTLWRGRCDRRQASSLDDTLFTVVGVMPASFENVLSTSAEIWEPLQYNPALPYDGREWAITCV